METGTFLRLLLTMAVAAVATAALQRNVGDACESKDRAAGICRSIADCPAAQDALRHGATPTPCSFQGFTPVVCCPAAAPAPAHSQIELSPLEQRLASKMCTMYAEAVFRFEQSSVLPSQTIKLDQCAKPPLYIPDTESAFLNEFPHMALLGYGDTPNWRCGGSLVSERFVLTAAHCLVTRQGTPKTVRLGKLNLKTTDELIKHEDFTVEQSVIHPEYKDGVFNYDVGLVRLDRDVTFTASIRPACLQIQKKVGDKAIAISWENEDFTTSEMSSHLYKSIMLILETQVCKDEYKTLANTSRLANGLEEETMLCVREMHPSRNCWERMSDSGGPLQVKLKSPYCMYSIVGITSFGKGNCGSSKSPAIYTRVSHYVSWIESVVWPNQK